jgi:hypothetical protein
MKEGRKEGRKEQRNKGTKEGRKMKEDEGRRKEKVPQGRGVLWQLDALEVCVPREQVQYK